jgi:hypothetical protein
MQNESQRIQVTITVQEKREQLPKEDVKYLRLHLDRRLTWHKHIFAKRKKTRNHPNQNVLVTPTKVKTLHKQQTSHIYKTILKPIWTYGIQLRGTASTSNIEIIVRFQSKALRMIVDAPWYVPNTIIRRISKYQQLKKKSAATALNIVLASAHIQMT